MTPSVPELKCAFPTVWGGVYQVRFLGEYSGLKIHMNGSLRDEA